MARALRIAPSEPSSGSVGTISAPNASRIAVFWAEEPLAGTQRVTGKPRALPIIASAIPVLPEVASRIVLPGASNPRRSPSKSMARAGRSLTLPPGFMCSALASRRRPGTPAAMRERSSSGVLPIALRRLTPGALIARDARTDDPVGLRRRETVSAQAFADEPLREPQPAEQRSLVPPQLLPRRLRVPLVDPEPSAGLQGPVDRLEPGLRLLPVMEGENRQREVELFAKAKAFDRALPELEIGQLRPSRRPPDHCLGLVHADDREARPWRGE